MAHEILSLKLCQLNDRLERLHSRIRISETAGRGQLRRQIASLEQECAESEATLRDSLHRSKSGVAPALAEGYEQMEAIIRDANRRAQAAAAGADPQAAVEEQLLMAEYALDFAQQAADRALLLSMKAIDAQLSRQEEGSAP